MLNKPIDYEYVYLECIDCKDRVKLAKNKGANWKTGYDPELLATFILNHDCCNIQVIGSNE